MPNWCHNKLTITGEPELVAECVTGIAGPDDAARQPLDFERITPMPEELLLGGPVDEAGAEERERRHGASDWYQWALRNWGTKWNANFEGVAAAIGLEGAELPRERRPILEPGRAFYAFETAWSPPIPVLSTLAGRHPRLEFELVWGEPGSAGAGRVRWRGGELVGDEALSIEDALTPEEMWF